ncbi:MAG: hypothetical protein WBP26_05480 [Candidatus Saccharimonadales bacterium]
MNIWYFAAAYGEGSYNNSCTYGDTSTTCLAASGAAGEGGASQSGGQLSDTGVVLIAVVTLACLLAAVAIIVRVAKRKAVKPVAAGADAGSSASPSQK